MGVAIMRNDCEPALCDCSDLGRGQAGTIPASWHLCDRIAGSPGLFCAVGCGYGETGKKETESWRLKSPFIPLF
jgi:hypothetical protein